VIHFGGPFPLVAGPLRGGEYNDAMPARPDPGHLAAWRALLETHAAVTELLARELSAERGLPLKAYDVLLNLAESPEGRLRMQELSASVLLSKSGLSRVVDRMEESGLVRRERSEDDRRGWFAVLTEQGRSALRRAAPVHLRGIQEHFARHLDDEEARVLAAALGRISAAARAQRDPLALRSASRADPAGDGAGLSAIGSAAGPAEQR
jgi:DNA-binding MarR family transcriptional regulator